MRITNDLKADYLSNLERPVTEATTPERILPSADGTFRGIPYSIGSTYAGQNQQHGPAGELSRS